jgi:Family of unknown function (DUF5317)
VLIGLSVALGMACLGMIRGGHPQGLAKVRLHGVWLVAAAVTLQVAARLWSGPWPPPEIEFLILLLSYLGLAAFLGRNRAVVGMRLAFLGLGLNLAVIAANGAMPVSQRAASFAGIDHSLDHPEMKHEPLTDASSLPWLGDVIPLPGLGEVLSLGDLLLAGGIGRFVYVSVTSVTADGAAEDIVRRVSRGKK